MSAPLSGHRGSSRRQPVLRILHIRVASLKASVLLKLRDQCNILSLDWGQHARQKLRAKQFRDAPSAPPSHQHLLGTDEIGRDRFARILYGTRISLLLAPAAALVSTVLAALVGGLARYLGGIWVRLAREITALFLSLPWLFLLITVRALLPLNVSPLVSVLITFLILGLLGSAPGDRSLP